MNSTLLLYGSGVAGSIAIELVLVLDCYRSSSGRLPATYRRRGFWIARILFAGLAGLLPLASGVTNYMAAIELGASAQIVLISISNRARHRTRPRT
jgi:hypothetical protein